MYAFILLSCQTSSLNSDMLLVVFLAGGGLASYQLVFSFADFYQMQGISTYL